jgi:ABC-type Fe3+-citrate transport system substrate-binding protein
MRFLNIVKKENSLSREAHYYIKNINTYKKVLKEAKKEIMIGMSKREQIQLKQCGS